MTAITSGRVLMQGDQQKSCRDRDLRPGIVFPRQLSDSPPMQLDHRMRIRIALALVLLIGCFLRLPPALFYGPGAPLAAISALHPKPKWDRLGFDEGLYVNYVDSVSKVGLANYPSILDRYIE